MSRVKEGQVDVLSHGGRATRECLGGPRGQQELVKFAQQRDGFPEAAGRGRMLRQQDC